jgi:exosortase family protein XrtF
MISKIKENPVLRFLTLALGLYVLWYILYVLLIQPYTGFDRAISTNLVHFSAFLMELFTGYESTIQFTPDMVLFAVKGEESLDVEVGDPCNGLELFVLFTIFIIAYPGPLKRKLWYIPAGMLAIHFINAVRVLVLTIIATENYKALDFQHDYTFTIVVYSFVFLLWYLWAVKFSKPPKPKESS